MFPALMPTYARADIAFARGEGAWLIATDGARYLDFAAGIATSALGHAHPHLTRALCDQAARVIHVSNLFRIPESERLAERLVAASFAESVFFCNSGAEANEGAVKLARRAMAGQGRPERWRVVVFDGAFHGRTLAMLAATGNAKYLDGFGPAVDGFDRARFGDLDSVRSVIGAHTAAILIEPVQGEGGIRVAPPDFLRALRALCDEHRLLLILDEVQCGMGRSGTLFAHEQAGIAPDILATAKGLGGGVPIGAILATEAVARHLGPGAHGTTFGGNPLAAAAANVVLDTVLEPGFLDRVDRTGRFLRARLEALVGRHPRVFDEARGMGLLAGLRCRPANTEVQRLALEANLLTVAAGENVLRLAPPLIVTETECQEAASRLDRVAGRLA